MVDIYQPREQSEPAKGDQPAKLSTDLRQSYVNYLTTGVTLGAGDFSDAYHGAGHTPLDDLHNQLPSNEALIDSALGALRQSSLPITPELVEQTKTNLANHWAATGEDPSTVAADPVKVDAMTRRPPLPISEEQFLALAEKDESAGKNVKNYMFDATHTASGYWQITNTTWKDTAPKVGVDLNQYPTADSAPRDVQKEVARQLFRDRGAQPWVDFNPKLAQDINLPPDLNKPARSSVFDPLKEFTAESASALMEGAKEVGKTLPSFAESLLLPHWALPAGAPTTGDKFSTLGDVLSFVTPIGAEGNEISQAAKALHDKINILAVGSVVGAGLRKMFSNVPEAEYLFNQEGRELAQSTIRMATGQGRQFIAAASEAMEQFRNVINKGIPEFVRWLATGPGHLSPMWDENTPELMHLIDHIEGGHGGGKLDPNSPLLPVADAIRALYQATRQQIEKELPDMTHFIEDYYRHMWTRPTDADKIFASRTGTSANLKARSIPTIADGIANGLKPRILDPIENALHYTTGMLNHLMAGRVLREGKTAGYVKYALPGSQPLGWVPLKGNSATIGHPGIPGATLRAYAPIGWASSYNNFVGRGFYDWGTGPMAGRVFDKVQKSSNFMTGMALGLSGYHAFTIAQATAASSIASGLGKTLHGAGRLDMRSIAEGMKDIGFGVTVGPALAQKYMQGKWLQKAYLGGNTDPLTKQLADIYAKVGGRAVGRAAEYGYTQANNWATAWQRGSLAMELKYGIQQTLGDAAEPLAKRLALGPGRVAGFFAHELARGMGTIMKPLFENAIPKIKMATWADEMSAWMQRNPGANHEAILAQGRKLSDTMDDRYGEMVQDNLFWARTLKQALNVGTVSVGWNWGTLRTVGGGVKDILNGDVLSARSRFLLAYPIAVGILGSAYQYLKTGVGPQSPMDLVGPKTGGTTPQGEPERGLMPGEQKEPLRYFHMMQTAPNALAAVSKTADFAAGKMSPFAQMLTGIRTNQDWRGDPNFSNTPDPDELEPPPQWKQFGRYVLEHYEPFGFSTISQRKRGTEISNMERLFGIRPAPAWMANPERDTLIQQKLQLKQQKVLQRHRAIDAAQAEE